MSEILSHIGFAAIVGGVRRGLAAHVSRQRETYRLAVEACRRVQRGVAALLALLALFRAGKLPVPRPSRQADAVRTRAAVSTTEPGARVTLAPAQPALPRERGWLLRMTRDEGARSGLILMRMLAEPEMIALLAASPRAGRLLRPLWFMLCPGPMPAALRLPARARPPRPPRDRSARTVRPPAPIEACRGAALDRRLACVLGGRPGVAIQLRGLPSAVARGNG